MYKKTNIDIGTDYKGLVKEIHKIKTKQIFKILGQRKVRIPGQKEEGIAIFLNSNTVDDM